MHIRKAGIVTAGALAAILVPIAASPASAADGQVSCSTTGGSGGASWTWSSKTKLSSIWLNVYDSKADGAHPAIRLVTVQNNGNVKLWKYRHMTSGAGETGNWNGHDIIEKIQVETVQNASNTLVRQTVQLGADAGERSAVG